LEFARQNGCAIVTLDSDFHDLSVLHGHPPKVLWLRCGNSSVDTIEQLLRTQLQRIQSFAADDNLSFLEVF
jgi:predicted nuclease of predicted toxin-antitoxin system